MRRRQRKQQPFDVRYVPIATDGSLDQTLTITNNTDVSVQPTLLFTPYSIYGHPLPHVTMIGVNGSHRGQALLPAGGRLREVLRFDGQGSDQVRGVAVELGAAEENDHPALEQDVRTVMIDLDQKATDEPEDFWGIGVVNPNPFGVTMRISLVRLQGGKATAYETFASGWLQGESAWGRPADLLVLPDGSLLVADDSAGAIYRIVYKG